MEKSTKTIFLSMTVAILLVISGAAAYLLNDDTVTSAGSVPASAHDVAKTGNTGTSLKDLLLKTEPTKCTVTTSSDMSDSSGVVYVANGKMRTDFTNTMKSGNLAGKVTVAHMIVDTDYSYMWGDGMMKVGIKMAKKDMLDVKPETGKTPQNQAAMDMNEKSDYHCDAWEADASQFVPPTTIEFQDVAVMMQGMPGIPVGAAGASGTKTGSGAVAVPPGMTKEQLTEMCGQCDGAGSGRDQCRAALGCK